MLRASVLDARPDCRPGGPILPLPVALEQSDGTGTHVRKSASAPLATAGRPAGQAPPGGADVGVAYYVTGRAVRLAKDDRPVAGDDARVTPMRRELPFLSETAGRGARAAGVAAKRRQTRTIPISRSP